jgi:hypothetical protein
VSGWQPIETAPKEFGPDILVWDGQFVTLAWWHGDEDEEEQYWRDSTAPDHSDGRLNPTHWMPLPEPPKGTKH